MIKAIVIFRLNCFRKLKQSRNWLLEELPEERQSRFRAFALGAGLYSALLVGMS